MTMCAGGGSGEGQGPYNNRGAEKNRTGGKANSQKGLGTDFARRERKNRGGVKKRDMKRSVRETL